jgi:hypothetical protein
VGLGFGELVLTEGERGIDKETRKAHGLIAAAAQLRRQA